MSERHRSPVYSDPNAFEPDQVWGPDDDPTIAHGLIKGKKSYHLVILPNEAGPDLRVKLPTQRMVVEVHQPDGSITYEPYDLARHGEYGDIPDTSKRGFQPEFGTEDTYDDTWK